MDDPLHWIPVFFFLSSFVFFGLPHGAVDHWLYFRGRGIPLTPKSLSLFCAVYFGIFVLFVFLWVLFPAPSAIGFLILTAYHWGEGEYQYEKIQNGNPDTLLAVLRGLMPMALPLVFHSETYRAVLAGAVRKYSYGDVPEFSFFAYPQTGISVVAIVSILLLLHLFRTKTKGSKAEGKRAIAVNLLFFCGFLFLPPLVSVGLYFMFWHSIRHIRVACKAIASPVYDETSGVSWLHFYWIAAPFTLLSILFLTILLYSQNPPTLSAQVILGDYLLLLWALTWPHCIVCHISLNTFLDVGKKGV
ncbi:MAG: Brp/Blh family beta-carotene 15,15'-dioxygenase [Verrucomicrobiota bacterium]